MEPRPSRPQLPHTPSAVLTPSIGGFELRLIAEGKLDVDCLTTHRIPLDRAEEEIAAIIDDPDEILGLVFQMNR